MPCPEYEGASARVGAALRACYGAACASIEQKVAVSEWSRGGAAWVDLVAALERYVDVARDSGEQPERMVVRLKRILEDTLPRDDLVTDLRDAVVMFSIATYFKQA